MKNYESLLLEETDGIIKITINRPKALNALNRQVFTELKQVFEEDIKPADIKGVIITGSGEKAFVAGADISEFTSAGGEEMMALSQRGQDIFKSIEYFAKPVIAVVNGYALGGGCELALACHMRIAETQAKFGFPEINLGILPGYGGTQRITQLIGKGRAIELMLTGNMMGSEEAGQLGVANHITPSGEGVALAKSIIEIIAKKAPLPVKEIIAVANAAYDETKDGFLEEVKAFGKLAETADFKEGANAFLEKRKAAFKGL
jgi:enoyl-CoA hydratase